MSTLQEAARAAGLKPIAPVKTGPRVHNAPRMAVVQFKLTRADMARLKDEAEAYGISLSQHLRHLTRCA